MKFTQLAPDAFEKIQLNAGVLLSSFDPESAEFDPSTDIVGASSGGIAFEATPNYVDFGEDIDNCPTGTKELNKLDYWEVLMSGSMVTIDPAAAALMAGAADVTDTKMTPRVDVLEKDYKDLWWVGDYSSDNTDENGGFVAIHMMNTLSTGGFKLQSNNKGKGMFEFEFKGHYSIKDLSKVPFEIYVKKGGAA